MWTHPHVEAAEADHRADQQQEIGRTAVRVDLWGIPLDALARSSRIPSRSHHQLQGKSSLCTLRTLELGIRASKLQNQPSPTEPSPHPVGHRVMRKRRHAAYDTGTSV